MNSYTQMKSGKEVDPWDLKPEDVELSDIVNNLQYEARFAGAAGNWTVAQHTMVVLNLVLSVSDDMKDWDAALLHDSAEAYLKDMPKPVKWRPEMAAYRDAEDRAMRVICQKFGVMPPSRLVKRMDEIATYLEAKHFLGELGPCWGGWKPQATEAELEEFADLVDIAGWQKEGWRFFWEASMALAFGEFGDFTEPLEGSEIAVDRDRMESLWRSMGGALVIMESQGIIKPFQR